MLRANIQTPLTSLTCSSLQTLLYFDYLYTILYFILEIVFLAYKSTNIFLFLNNNILIGVVLYYPTGAVGEEFVLLAALIIIHYYRFITGLLLFILGTFANK